MLSARTSTVIIEKRLHGELSMKRFIEGEDRAQSTLLPERLDDYIVEDNPVRVVDVFVDEPSHLRPVDGADRRGP